VKGRRTEAPTTRRRGQALVEFALVLPIALMLLLGVFDLGRAVFIYNTLTNAAREGARLAIVNQDVTLVEQRVQETAFGSDITNAGDPTDPVVTYYHEEPNIDDPTANAECTTIVTGCIAVVTAKTDWTAITPIIGTLVGPIALTARSELPIEFVCPNPIYPSYTTADLCPKQP
jgi:Flp pilus assembly protein TadG